MGTDRLSATGEARCWAGVRDAGRFFMGQADVRKALEKLTRTLDGLGVPYAIVGALALNEYGYRRTTVDVDVPLTADGLARFKAAMPGRGYEEKLPDSRGVQARISLDRCDPPDETRVARDG